MGGIVMQYSELEAALSQVEAAREALDQARLNLDHAFCVLSLADIPNKSFRTREEISPKMNALLEEVTIYELKLRLALKRLEEIQKIKPAPNPFQY